MQITFVLVNCDCIIVKLMSIENFVKQINLLNNLNQALQNEKATLKQ